MTLVSLSWSQNNRRPLGLVGAVGIVLCFQTNGSPLRIGDAFLSFHRSVQEVSCIHLDTWFIGVDLQADTCGRTSQFGSQLVDVTFGLQYPVMVESVTEFHLFVGKVCDIRTDGLRRVEVERSIFTAIISPVVMKVLSTGVMLSEAT